MDWSEGEILLEETKNQFLIFIAKIEDRVWDW